MLLSSTRAFADPKDNDDLGIPMSKGASVDTTLKKVNTVTSKVDKAKSKIAEIFTGHNKSTEPKDSKTAEKSEESVSAVPGPDGDVNAELGIQMSKGLNTGEALQKANALTSQYQNATNRITGIFTGQNGTPQVAIKDTSASHEKPKQESAPVPVKQEFLSNEPIGASGLTLSPHSEDSGDQSVRRTIRLKNGRTLRGAIVQRDEKGFWVETAPGASIYFSNIEAVPEN